MPARPADVVTPKWATLSAIVADELDKAGAYKPGKLSLARNLNEAQVNEVLVLDKKGRAIEVRSSALSKIAAYSIGAAAWVGLAVFGEASAAIYAVGFFGIFMAVLFAPAASLRKGMRAQLDGQFDAAIARLSKVQRSRFTLRDLRATAALYRGNALWCKGELEAALEQARATKAMYRASKHASHVVVRQAMMLEVHLLVELDRLAKARGALDRLLRLDDLGETLRMATWGAQLAVCMAEGRHPLTDDELHTRTMAALPVTSAAPLLAMLSWAHHVSKNDEQAWHLLREAFDREWSVMLRHGLTGLRNWMQTHAKQAGVQDA